MTVKLYSTILFIVHCVKSRPIGTTTTTLQLLLIIYETRIVSMRRVIERSIRV